MRLSTEPLRQCGKSLDFGTWDVGNFRFKGRQISQMPNGEIVCDMEQYKHELEQIDVSKADKTKPERVLNSKEHTQFRGGVGSLGWFVDHCCPQLSFLLAELRRKQARMKEVRHNSVSKHHELSRSCVCAELAEQEDQEGCPQQFGCRDMHYVDLPRTSRLDAHNVGTDDPW